MNLLREDFKDGEPISAVGTGWLNAVGRFINRLTGKNGIRVTKYGQFPTIELDLQDAGEFRNPTATKGVSVHGEYPELADFYDIPDKEAHPTDPAIVYPEFQPRLDLDGDHVPPDRMTGADNTTPVGWERGKTAWKNGHEVGNPQEIDPQTGKPYAPVGCSMTVCTHMRQVAISGISKYQVIFSRMEFDENGMLVRVVPCSNWFTMM